MCRQWDPQPRRTGEPLDTGLQDSSLSPRCVDDLPSFTNQAQAQRYQPPSLPLVPSFLTPWSFLPVTNSSWPYPIWSMVPQNILCHLEPNLLWSHSWFQGKALGNLGVGLERMSKIHLSLSLQSQTFFGYRWHMNFWGFCAHLEELC